MCIRDRICSASTRSSGRWSLISEYVRKPRSLPSLIRFLRRVRRVSASSGVGAGPTTHSSLRLLRPPRTPLPLPLTSATFASSSSSACFALLKGVFAFLSSTCGAAAFACGAALAGGAFWARAGALARSSFFAVGALCDLVFRLLTALAFFFAARRTFFAFTLRFRTILPPVSRLVSAHLGETVPVSYTHLRAHETPEHLVCRLLL